MKNSPMNNLDAMIDWENGRLDEEQEVELFQTLVNNGMAFRLQGCYGRRAAALIAAGEVMPPQC